MELLNCKNETDSGNVTLNYVLEDISADYVLQLYNRNIIIQTLHFLKGNLKNPHLNFELLYKKCFKYVNYLFIKNINYTITGNIFIIFDMNFKNFIIVLCTKDTKIDEKLIVNISIDRKHTDIIFCNYENECAKSYYKYISNSVSTSPL